METRKADVIHGSHQLFVFNKHFFDNILSIRTQVTLSIPVKLRWNDWFAVLNYHMSRRHLWKIGFPDVCGIADRDRNDRTLCSGCDLETTVMK